MDKPYDTSKHVVGQRFYGRGSLARLILRPVGDLIWLIGNRRVGKTSLLRELQYLGNKSGHFVALFLEFTGAETLSDWTQCLHEAVWKSEQGLLALADAQIDISDCHGLDFFELQRALVRKAEQRNRRLLLLCDEVEAWLVTANTDSRLIQLLRREWSSTLADKLKVVISATKRLNQLKQYEVSVNTSPLLTHFASAYLGPFEDQEADELIQQTKSTVGRVEVAHELKGHIMSYSGNHPFLLQKLCSLLYEEDTQGRRKLRNIRKDDLIADDTMKFLFETDHDSLSSDERRFLLELAATDREEHALTMSERELQARTNLPAYAVSNYTHTLLSLGFIRRSGTRLHIGNYFLWQWLNANWQTLQDKLRYPNGPDEGTVLGLPTRLYANCRAVLMKCREFQSFDALGSVFIVDVLRPFRPGLRKSDSLSTLLDLNLEYLLQQRTVNGRPALLAFLAALQDRYEQGDALRDELQTLYKAVDIATRRFPA